MSNLIVTLVAVGAFAAGYLLRGLLAVVWERKRQHRPLSGLSDQLLRGFIQIADGHWGQPASFHARQEIKNEVRQRNPTSDRQDAPPTMPPAGPLPRSHPRQRGEQTW